MTGGTVYGWAVTGSTEVRPGHDDVDSDHWASGAQSARITGKARPFKVPSVQATQCLRASSRRKIKLLAERSPIHRSGAASPALALRTYVTRW
jgi:hypothetical protein